MNIRNVALVLTMALLAGCSSAPVGVEAGPNGVLSASLTINDDKVLVEGRDGSLLVNGEVRGDVREGDWVTVDWDGAVHVNGRPR